MKPNYIDFERTFTQAEIAEQNQHIDSARKKILPQATLLFKKAVQQQTANVTIGEARTVLNEMLQDVSDEHFEETQKYIARNVLDDLLHQPPLEATNDEWISSRSQDLALAVATFWYGLGASDQLRHKRCAELLTFGADWEQQPELVNLRLIASRFYLGEEAYTLLELLQNQARSYYEIVFAVHPDQSRLVPGMIKEYKNFIIKAGGTVFQVEDWGFRSIGFAIAGLKQLYFFSIDVECDRDVLEELTKIVHTNSAVLRLLPVKIKSARSPIQEWRGIGDTRPLFSGHRETVLYKFHTLSHDY